MSQTLKKRPNAIRVLRRSPVSPPTPSPLRVVRPSLLDLRFVGDAWLLAGDDGSLTLSLGDYPLAAITGLALDLPSLNNLLDRARHRRPRWRSITRTNLPA
jgi:hypothetical protein